MFVRELQRCSGWKVPSRNAVRTKLLFQVRCARAQH